MILDALYPAALTILAGAVGYGLKEHKAVRNDIYQLNLKVAALEVVAEKVEKLVDLLIEKELRGTANQARS